MEKNKKGTDRNSAPKGDSPNKNVINYSRLNKFCLGLMYISIIAFFVAYFYKSRTVMAWCGGSLVTDLLILTILNPIKEDE